MCSMNAIIYDCMQMENSARVDLYTSQSYTTQHTRGVIHRSGNAATKITKSACFNARIQLDGLNVYKTDASYKGKYIWTVFDVIKGFRKKCTFICEASNRTRLTKNKCRLQREVHRRLEMRKTSCRELYYYVLMLLWLKKVVRLIF